MKDTEPGADMVSLLLIGYGNPLRGDDSVGQRVAEAVAGWKMANVHALAVHQLVPELAEQVASARTVVFVDASAGEDDGALTVRRIGPAGRPLTLGHMADPRALLALVQVLHGRHPSAWWVTVPGVKFDLGEEISPTAAAGMEIALSHIAHWAQGDS
jgi:hydrogenase maturation protease